MSKKKTAEEIIEEEKKKDEAGANAYFHDEYFDNFVGCGEIVGDPESFGLPPLIFSPLSDSKGEGKDKE